MLAIILVAVALLMGGYLAFSKRLRESETWTALSTPLASIMGSGFLISAPLLAGLVGVYALPCMVALLVLAYGIGGVMRYNIRHFEPIEGDEKQGLVQRLAHFSRFVLAAAYFISISYYLQLLSAFSLHHFEIEAAWGARLMTSSLLVLICGIGIWKGLKQLEKLEHPVLGLNLGIIAALLVGLIVFNLQKVMGGDWALPTIESQIDFADFRVLLGLLIVVQGFETSRYLGEEHEAEMRVRTMRWAQLISAVIYVVFIGLCTVLFHEGLDSNVTAIISLVGPVSVTLPILLTIAAVGSQFSAAVADTSGGGGLLKELSKGRLSTRMTYLIILAITLAITWLTDIHEIISYASRAFAAFYFLQCLVASVLAQRSKSRLWVLFAALSVVSLAVVVLGLPSE